MPTSMTSEAITIADAVVTRLKAVGISEAERRLFVENNLKTMKALKITVVPLTFASEPESRSSDELTISIQIGIQQLIQGSSYDMQIESLVEKTRYMISKLNRFRFDSLNAKVMSVMNEPVYDMVSLQQQNLFISVITLSVAMSIPAEVQHA